MKSLNLLLAGAVALALSAGAVTARDRTKDQTQYRSETQQKDAVREQTRDRYDQATPGRSSQSSSSTSGRLRELDQLGSARILFYRLGPADMRMSKLMGLDVRNLQNEDVGEIEDVILDNGKTMRAVIVAVGGFLGMGERYVAVDPASIVISRNDDGDVEAVINSTREDLRDAPEFRFEGKRKRVGKLD